MNAKNVDLYDNERFQGVSKILTKSTFLLLTPVKIDTELSSELCYQQ